TINFIAPLPKWDTEKPFNLAWPLPADQPKINSIYDKHEVQIADGRGREGEFSLDLHGFAFAKMSAKDSLRSKEAIQTEYVAQVESWLKQFLGAEKVVAFDFAVGPLTFKRSSSQRLKNDNSINQTLEAALSRLRLYFDGETESLVNGRVRFINVWRSLIEPLEDTPLAVMDAQSLAAEDLMAHDIVYPHHLGENYLVKFNSNHRWYYLSRMTTEECILIKNLDSELHESARMCPHAGFEDANTPPKAPWRKSVEVRLIVFN
ncbi:hypothetical protein B0T25DRAFT_463170, partial [Lasiosphaeria hispida]